MNQNAKTIYNQSYAKVVAIFKLAAACCMALAALLAFISVSKATGGAMGSMSSDVFGILSSSFMFGALPLFVLTGTALVWTIAFFRSSSPNNDGRVLDSASVSSATSSSIGSFLCLTLVIFISAAVLKPLDYQISYISRSYSNSGGPALDNLKFVQGILTFLIIILIIGMLTLIATSVFRKMFYSSVEKTFKNEAPNCRMSIPYMVMLFVNSVVRLMLLIWFVILLSKGASLSSNSGAPFNDGTATFAYVCVIIYIAIGIAGNIIEALMVRKYSSLLANPNGGAASYGANPYANPNAQTPYYGQDGAAAAPDVPTCPVCGTVNNAYSMFCKGCGNKLR